MRCAMNHEAALNKEHAKLYAISVGASEAGFRYLLDALGLSEPEVRGALCYGIFTAS